MEILESGKIFDESMGSSNTPRLSLFTSLKMTSNLGTEGPRRDPKRTDDYHAISKFRCQLPITAMKMDDLTNAVLIPATAYCPLFPSNFTRAPDLLPAICYIKRPRLSSLDQTHDDCSSLPIHERVLKEAEVCKILSLHPHLNIAQYFGCQVRNERIAGICFTKYRDSSMDRVNPKSQMKRVLQYSERPLKKRDGCLKGIDTGLRHLYRLSFVHNDINPTNIMFDSDDNPVIIDFGSC